jgi:hypothetical protein
MLIRSLLPSPEECLLRKLWALGSVGTIARPRDDGLPWPGRVEITLSDHEWQTRVSRLISIAELVVIRLGATANVDWEVAQAAALKQKEQLLFWYPPSDTWGSAKDLGTWEDVRGNLERCLNTSVPAHLERGHFLYFDSVGELVISPSLNRFLKAKNCLIEGAIHLGFSTFWQLAVPILFAIKGWAWAATWCAARGH